MSKREGGNDNDAAVVPEAKVFLPGKTIGMLGSGQLGRMSAMAAKNLGYKVVVYDAVPEGPACSCADLSITAPFTDREALGRFAEEADVVTLEFENIPIAVLEFLETKVPVRPSASVVRICQDRILEKEFLQNNKFPVAPFRVVTSVSELMEGMSDLSAPSILKTAALGYDGKGQVRISPGDDLNSAWGQLSSPRGVLEKMIPFDSECSVICSRSPHGETRCFPVQENIHRDGILDITIAPACIAADVAANAQQIASSIAEKLGVIGLITVEFFVLPDGSLMVNELAPRPHNSGHHTIETTLTSQFAQHIRAVCGLPLGPVEMRSPGVMINLLGDLWRREEPDWEPLLSESGLFLHLYGKSKAKPGRKMGHFTLLETGGNTRERALALRAQLIGKAD
ncbi:MAG: 5-(carboxyamino)imidazole ribonucleotide synthase [bacterium]